MARSVKYILDTNAIFRNPEILSRAVSRELVIPEIVFEEFSNYARRSDINRIEILVSEALNRGVKVAPNSPNTKHQLISEFGKKDLRLSDGDFEIASIALDLTNEIGSQAVCVISSDRYLAKFLQSKNIRTITGSQFLIETEVDIPDSALQTSAKNVTFWQFASFVLNISGGAFVAFVASIVFLELTAPANIITNWSIVFLIPLFMLGVLLYWFRQKYRLAYGVFEVVIGLIFCYNCLSTNSSSVFNMSSGLQIVAALYVMVRGLDNISQGLKGTRFESTWKYWFG